MSFILITGSFAVISNELDWVFNPEMRAFPKADLESASWGTLYESATAYNPDLHVVGLSAPIGSWFAAQARTQTKCGGLVRLHLDPYTAEVLGMTGWFNIQRFFRMLHRHLMLPTNIGVPIVSSLSFLLIISVVSGLVVYKKWWSGFFKKPSECNQRRFFGDLHRLGGLWSMWFILIIALTSLWYLFESVGWRAPPFPKFEVADTGVSTASQSPVAAGATDSELTGAVLDRIVSEAQGVIQGLQVTHIDIRLSSETETTVSVRGLADAMLVRPRANQVGFDSDYRLQFSHRGEQLSVHQRISEMADPLHFGTLGGNRLAIKLIWFALGLIMTMLSVTGIWIYGLRVMKSIGLRQAVEPDPDRRIWRGIWRGMGAWRFPAIALVSIGLVLSPLVAQRSSLESAFSAQCQATNT